METIGQRISPILNEIEDTLWEHESRYNTCPEFTDEGFRSAMKIFMATLMDKMWRLQEAENMPFGTRVDMAQRAGEAIREIEKTYTDIDTHNIYK